MKSLKPGDPVRIEYIRPGKNVAYYDEDFLAQDKNCLRTFKTLQEDISDRLSRALLKQNLIQSNQRVGSKAKVYHFNEPFNLLEFRDLEGIPLGHYSDIGEPTIQHSPTDFQMTDLFLDIWLFPDGRLLELDWDEFENAIQNQVITPAQANLAERTMKRLVDEAASGVYPTKYIKHSEFHIFYLNPPF